MAYMDFNLKKFTSIPDRLSTEMNKCIQKTEILGSMTKRKITLIQKDPLKGPTLKLYRHIMWKILTVQISENIYYSAISHGLFPNEQKGFCKRARDTEELLFMDQHIINENKTSRNNIAVVWNDQKKRLRYGPPKVNTTLPHNV